MCAEEVEKILKVFVINAPFSEGSGCGSRGFYHRAAFELRGKSYPK
jgi:hypothetical protein